MCDVREDTGSPVTKWIATDADVDLSVVAHWISSHQHRRRLLDVRDRTSFCVRHIAGSSNIPVEELQARKYELPASASVGGLCVFADTKHHGRKAVEILAASQRGIDYVVLESPAFWDYLTDSAAHLVGTGPKSSRIWDPSPVLQEFLEPTGSTAPSSRILIDPLTSNKFDDLCGDTTTEQPKCKHTLGVESNQDPGSAQNRRPLAIDLGCGCGRDAVYLAARGWQVIAVDNRPKMLQRAVALAVHESVEHCFQASETDLEREWPWDKEQADLVVCIRFLVRSLFPKIADVVRPGGYIIYSHFLEGCGKPRSPKHFLFRGELAQVFGPPLFEVLQDAETIIEDGRPVCCFLARKHMA